MNIVIAGHVDHGKSTIIGRLLSDSGSLPEGKLEQIKMYCEKNSKPFEYAFILDALKDEQSQGITIDTARVFFKSKKRNYIIIDAPGHIEFLKNMVSGASRAEAALLVIDANEGIKENSKRHGYLLAMLGIKQIAVLINKMDLVSYKESIYNNIVKKYSVFLKNIGIKSEYFLPISGMEGINIVKNSNKLAWYKGLTILELLDNFKEQKSEINKPFRMPVQDIYKFTNFDDNRRIIAGQIESGRIHQGDEIVFYPSGKKSTINTIEGFNNNKIKNRSAGKSVGFTMSEQIYIKRGEIACKVNEHHPIVGSRIIANLFWLGKQSFIKGKNYLLKIGTSKVFANIEKIEKTINASNLSIKNNARIIQKNDVAECVLKLSDAIAFDTNDILINTSRFVIIDEYEIAGGGIITGFLKDELVVLRKNVFERNYKWETSNISSEQRNQRFKQKPLLVLITGPKNSGRKEIARLLEKKIFDEGKSVYFLGIGNIKYGVDADIKNKIHTHNEHIRRLAEVSHIMLDSGLILIVTAQNLSFEDLEIIKTSVNPENIVTVWVGNNVNSYIPYNVKVPGLRKIKQSVKIIYQELFNN